MRSFGRITVGDEQTGEAFVVGITVPTTADEKNSGFAETYHLCYEGWTDDNWKGMACRQCLVLGRIVISV